jgi:hypothetical protein
MAAEASDSNTVVSTPGQEAEESSIVDLVLMLVFFLLLGGPSGASSAELRCLPEAELFGSPIAMVLLRPSSC